MGLDKLKFLPVMLLMPVRWFLESRCRRSDVESKIVSAGVSSEMLLCCCFGRLFSCFDGLFVLVYSLCVRVLENELFLLTIFSSCGVVLCGRVFPV